MKEIRIKLKVTFLLILLVGFISCDNNDTNVELQNEIQPIDENTDALSSAYSTLYMDLLKNVFQEYEQFSNLDSQADIEKHFEQFAESYMENLTDEELALVNRRENKYNLRSSKEVGEAIAIPEEFINTIKPLMFDEDLDLMIIEIDRYYNSKYFLSLNDDDQKELTIQLETLKKTRDAIVEAIIENYYKENPSLEGFRLSPGDRMVWSETAKQLNDKQLGGLTTIGIGGIGLVSNLCIAFLLSIIAAILTML